MTSETKKHIDVARQILVGVVPNPTSQIDQITNALIYKFMDDMDQSAIKQGGDPSFFIGDLKKYSWTKLMDARVGNQEKMNIYGEALVKFSESKQLPTLFREIFKSAFLPHRSPEVLGLFLKEIDFFDYSHPEELGNAYEYLLSVMGSQGDAGQFRTPRHIIDFMVKVVDPSVEDKVLDPACGTGGFLVSAYKHILEKHGGKDSDSKKNNEKPLTPDQRKKLAENFEGYDIDPGMVRIAQVNMYLHQFKNPKIHNYDTLTMEERWGDKFSVILANPPFMSPKGGVSTHSKFSIQSGRSEVLFVDYIMNHLRPNGRAGIIVPEGIIFQSGSAHKQLRKNLVEDGLCAVVSLPSGVFQPYSGVKTSILIFNNELSRQSKEILFIKIENDGFDLGANKRVISKNDLPEALEILNKWKKGNKAESKLALYIEKIKIAESGDYNLSGDRYKITTDYTNAKWPMVELGDIVEILDNKRKPITKSDRKAGQFPYYGATGILDYVHDYIFDERLVLIGEDGAKWDIGDKTAFIAEGKYWVNNHAHVVRPIKSKLIDTFLVSYLNNIDLSPFITGVTVPKLNQEKLRSIKIPLPPLEVQEKIVTELDSYQNIITGAKQIVSNWKPTVEIDPKWKKMKLGDVCEIGSSKRVFESEWKKEGVPFYRAREIVKLARNGFVENELFISEEMFKRYSKKYGSPKEGDLMITGVGTLGICYLVKAEDRFYFKDGNIIWMKNFTNNINSRFISYLFEDTSIIDQIKATAAGGTVGTYTITNANDTIIPLPPIEVQKQIVERIESERIFIEGNKKLIEIYEQKTKDVLTKLWGE